jgi:uncharacterized protein (UPF0333 family)
MELRPLLQRKTKAQSSLELLITLSFGLIILLPIVVLAFIQISNSTSTLSTTESQAAAATIADIATEIGSQGYPARQLVLIEVPPSVQIIFVVNTNAGPSYVSAYTPVNVSGYISQLAQPGTYLINISAQNSCPSNPSVQCVYIKAT